MKNKIVFVAFSLFLLTKGFSQNQYTNPILAGFYPDPSICRVGTDYYLVNSSFAYYPGLPIFHSKDLVSWKQVGYAMNRPEQLNLTGAGVSRGLFAPTIRYHKGLYYIICTLIDKGGNFVITAKNPLGPWTNPVWIKEVDGIDPSLFFDGDRAYLVYNSVAPDNNPLYNGHRTIRIREFDSKTMKVSSQELTLVNGGTDISKKPVWIEGPHIYKINNWYYLMCAEGGTEDNHSEVIFRSKSVLGPYINYENNPILTQRQLDPKRKNPITSTGHADLVETPGGKWYAVFLGCRPYEDSYYNTGRETFMAPVHWTNEWPVITKGNEEVKYHYPLPLPYISKKQQSLFSGNFTYIDDFTAPRLNNRYSFLRTLMKKWYSLDEKKGYLSMDVRPETISGKENPSFIGQRQQHLKCTATTSLLFTPVSENEKAGIVIFQSEHNFYYLCKSLIKGKPVVQLLKSTSTEALNLIASKDLTRVSSALALRIKANRAKYDFYYSTDNTNWQLLKAGVDGKFLSTKVAGGFVGSLFGLYATSSGKLSHTKAYFDWLEYKGDDDVYKK
jgi:xylan 1,4-beta-xylosidase